MRTKIYQINTERDTKRVKFMGMDNLPKFQNSEHVDPSIYDEVFNADIPETELESIYAKFNIESHPLHRGHSLSVSDVVVNDNGAFFCDSIGFKEIEFDETLTQKPSNLMRVVYVEPGRKPYVAEIGRTLETEQKAVGGMIEPVYNDQDNTCLVGNEEAKLIGLKGNRHYNDCGSIIAGPFFVCGLTEDDFRSLTNDEVSKYMERFAEPEEISDEEVRSDMGYFIFSGM